MTEAQNTTRETNRDRVRRLFIEPMLELGFRFKNRTPEQDQRKRLDAMADDLGYLTDENLQRVFATLRSKGEGSSRCFWPTRATMIAYAQIAQPRPVEEIPGLASWFGSVAGREALAEGRLVAEYRFWIRSHRPPMHEVEKRRVAEAGRQDASRAELLREKAQRMDLDQQDQGWLDAFERHHAAAIKLVRAEKQRGAA